MMLQLIFYRPTLQVESKSWTMINFKYVAFCTYGELVGTEKGGCEGVEA